MRYKVTGVINGVVVEKIFFNEFQLYSFVSKLVLLGYEDIHVLEIKDNNSNLL